MPTSDKQLAANRRNAQKSTGPRTPEGKAVACRNAITHGLQACDIILESPRFNEDPAEYEQLVASLVEELKPQGVLQEHLVLKIANSLWRYRRVINAETAKINRQLTQAADDLERGYFRSTLNDPDDPDPADQARIAGYIGTHAAPRDSYHTSLMQYEMRLDRQLARSFHLLMQLQLMQNSKSLPILPAEDDIRQNEPVSPAEGANRKPPTPVAGAAGRTVVSGLDSPQVDCDLTHRNRSSQSPRIAAVRKTRSPP